MNIDVARAADENSSSLTFKHINRGYNALFQPDHLSIGLVVPVESYAVNAAPTMQHQIERIQYAEQLGFSAVWLRDIPFFVPSFGDVGQLYDPFVYLGLLAGATQDIALGIASVVLPLRHPAHVAKAAASVDVLSKGRLILGVASGDRPDEYPALNVPIADSASRFRDSFDYIRQMANRRPEFENSYGRVSNALDMLPKPTAAQLPLMITGSSQQTVEWIANNGDGWMLYPRDASTQSRVIREWRRLSLEAGVPAKPAMEPLYIDLIDDITRDPEKIHLGYRLNAEQLCSYVRTRQEIGINHIALNLRFNQADITLTLQRLAAEVLPEFTK